MISIFLHLYIYTHRTQEGQYLPSYHSPATRFQALAIDLIPVLRPRVILESHGCYKKYLSSKLNIKEKKTNEIHLTSFKFNRGWLHNNMHGDHASRQLTISGSALRDCSAVLQNFTSTNQLDIISHLRNNFLIYKKDST